MPNVLTANRLTDGNVVYLGASGEWVHELSAATVATDDARLETLQQVAMASVAGQSVVGIYAIDVDLSGGKPAPRSVREKIRAARRQSFQVLTEREIR